MQRQQLLNILTIFFAVLFVLGLCITGEIIGWSFWEDSSVKTTVFNPAVGIILSVFSGLALLIRWKSFLDEK